MNNTPLVSVLITVYNGMPLLKKVITHLLEQTYTNLEIVVVDDASADDSLSYLHSIEDKRLKVFNNGKLGRGKALNYGLAQCTGKYVAINDADDISLAERIQLQVDFLEKNPAYGLVGSNFVKVFGEDKKEYSNKSLDNDSLRVELSKHSCIQHSCVLFQRSVLERVGGYNLKINYLYDRDIYIRVAKISKIANLPNHLVLINRHENQYFNSTYKGFERKLYSLKYGYIAIRELDLPKVLYIKRSISFIYIQLLNSLHSFKLLWKK